MPLPAVSAERVEELRSAASRAQSQAAETRRLALDIDRRREIVLRRDDACLARHTPEVWSSAAATVSREGLRSVVGFSLWATGDSLEDTRSALERHAQGLDGSASSYLRQADFAQATLLAQQLAASLSVESD